MSKELVKEYERYYDPETNTSRDDEGNVWKGKTPPNYDSNQYRRSGKSYSNNSSTVKEIPADKIYIGREVKNKSTLLYFIYQTIGLMGSFLKLPSEYSNYTDEQIRKDAIQFFRDYFNDETITNIKIGEDNKMVKPNELRQIFREYYSTPIQDRKIDKVDRNLELCCVWDTKGSFLEIGTYPDYLKEINIPDNIITIGRGALRDYDKTEIITIPDSVKYIEIRAFLNTPAIVVFTQNSPMIPKIERGDYKIWGLEKENIRIVAD